MIQRKPSNSRDQQELRPRVAITALGDERRQAVVRYNCRMTWRAGWILLNCGAAGALAGFAALAVAAAGEPTLPTTLVAVFSPGLRAAELLVPGRHESLGWTFGWFLRIAILTNALYYFVLFSCGAYFTRWLSQRSAKP